MPPLTYINGSFVDPSEATLPAFDAGMQHGVGLFETMLCVGPRDTGGAPRIHRLAEHLGRLADSVIELRLADVFDAAPLGELCLETLRRSGLCDDVGSRARLRLTVTGGDLNLLEAARQGGGGSSNGTGAAVKHRPSVMIHAQPVSILPDEVFEKGITTVISDLKLNPLDPHEGHKTIDYWKRLSALQRAAASGAGEGMVFTVSNHLAGACVANVCMVKGGSLLTPTARGEEEGTDASVPSLVSPVLPGITRAAVMEIAQEARITVTDRWCTIDDLLDADEVFLTNSTQGVMPISRIEGHVVGGGSAGEVTRMLREKWLGELA